MGITLSKQDRYDPLKETQAQDELSADFRGPDSLRQYRTLVVLETDVPSTASTSFQDVVGLKFDVSPGFNYRFYVMLLYTTSAATIGIRAAINAPTATHLAYTTRVGISATGSTDASWENWQTAVDLGTTSADSLTTTTGNLIILEGVVRPSAGGTVQVRFAPETATASGVVIEAGSTLEWW